MFLFSDPFTRRRLCRSALQIMYSRRIIFYNRNPKKERFFRKTGRIFEKSAESTDGATLTFFIILIFFLYLFVYLFIS